MSDKLQQPNPPDPKREEQMPVEGELEQLRRLLLGKEQGQILDLSSRIEQIKPTSDRLAPLLPGAIDLSRKTDDKQLTNALMPTVEKAIQISVKKDSRPLVEALFPVMGPAIRKSIAETFRAMLQSLNEALETSFSPKGIKWRFEAWRTGKSFAEVVLLHNLVFRVEQIFLIHHETGLLLQHAIAEQVQAQDSDMVTGMFTAIQDFVQDSFSGRQGDKLGTLEVGDLAVWVVQGPRVTLAAAIRGTAPQRFRNELHEILEYVEQKFSNELDEFDGNTGPFALIQDTLQEGLRAQYKEEKKKSWKALFAITAVAALVLAGLGYLAWQNMHWADYLNSIESEPGLVVIESHSNFGRYHLSGLRDPMATDPEDLLAASKVKPEKVSAHWQPFQSFDDELLLKRVKSLINPPGTVSIRVENGVLTASGNASHQWIANSRDLLRTLPGISAFETGALMDETLQSAQELIERIEKVELFFRSGSTRLLPDQHSKIDLLIRDIKQLTVHAGQLNQTLSLQLIGRTDSLGSEKNNVRLSQKRAKAIAEIMLSNGIKNDILLPVGMGNTDPLGSDNTEKGRQRNRSVVLVVRLSNAVP